MGDCPKSCLDSPDAFVKVKEPAIIRAGRGMERPALQKEAVMGNEERARGETGSLGASRLDQPMSVTPDKRHEMIARAAYYRAERRGFACGEAVKDWWEAAAVIDLMLENMSKGGVTRGDYERVGLRNALRLWVE